MNPTSLVGMSLTALNAAMGFYLACFAYRVLAHAAMYAAMLVMIVLHLLGIDAPVFGAIAILFERMRDSTSAMFVTAAASVLLVASIGRRRAQKTFRARVATSAIIAGVFAAALAVDLLYRVTPLDELPMMDAVRLHQSPTVSRTLTVRDVKYLRDDMSGTFAEVEGILDYDGRMRRFSLRSPEQRDDSIAAYFHRGIRTSLADRLSDRSASRATSRTCSPSSVSG